MTELVFAVVEPKPHKLTPEIEAELPKAHITTLSTVAALEALLGDQDVDGVVIDFEGIDGDSNLIRWINDRSLTCGILLVLEDLDLPGLRNLYLNGKVEVIGAKHAKADTLVRAVRHSIEKRRLAIKAEQAIRETEQLAKTLAALTEHSRGAVLILDQTEAITFVNSEAVRLFAIPEHELLGQQFDEVVGNLKNFMAAEFMTTPDQTELQVDAWDGTWLGEASTFVHLMPKVPVFGS